MEFSDGRTVGEQVIGGVLLTLKALLIWAFAGMLLEGLDLLLFPGWANPMSLSGRHPFVMGTILLAIVTVTLISTIDHWIIALPGFLGYCAFAIIRGSILFGHTLGGRTPIPSSTVAFLAEFFVLNMFLSITFIHRNFELAGSVCSHRVCLLPGDQRSVEPASITVCSTHCRHLLASDRLAC